MKNSVFCILTALLLQTARPPACALAESAPASRPAGAAKRGDLAGLEQKLLGVWWGDPCVGNYTFSADGTYTLRDFTPGNNTLTGTWSLRWDALPPTLVLTCKTSDFKVRDPGRREYEYFDKPLEIKVVELSNEAVVLRFPGDKRPDVPSDYTEKYERRARSSRLTFNGLLQTKGRRVQFTGLSAFF